MMNRCLICGPKDYNKHQLVQQLFELSECENIKNGELILNDLELNTKYYNSKITVFIDEPETNTLESLIEWIKELMSDEMKELRAELQYILLISENEDEDEHYDSLIGIVDELNDLLNKEHCESHPQALQWDGELMLISRNQMDIKECTSLLHCVVWRHLQIKEFEFDKELALLKNARDSHKGPVLSLQERQLVDRIVDKICSE